MGLLRVRDGAYSSVFGLGQGPWLMRYPDAMQPGPADAVRHVDLAGAEERPCWWLLESADLLRPGARALDVACGTGRHALMLAAAGLVVRAIDRDPERIGRLRASAARRGLDGIESAVLDLEAEGVALGEAAYDLIVVVNYLHRPLFPALLRALAAGGLLLYETFTVGQALRGKPTNPDFLLKPGELRRLVGPLAVVREREGEFEGRLVASVAARKA
jgi:SAM-dependent methyltransferase